MKKNLFILWTLTSSLWAADGEFMITKFGAVADGTTLNTAAIQKAIDAAALKGGEVEIPAGKFLSGSIFLKEGVSLHLAKDAVLLGSKNIEDYPKQNTRIEGHFEPWRMALINASELSKVQITGDGTLDGNGITYWAKFWQRRKENPKCTNLEVERPRLVFIDRCKNVSIKDVTLRYSGFWNLHLYNSQDVLVENVAILAPSRHPNHMNYMTPELLKKAEEQEKSRNAPVSDHILGPSTDGIDVDSSQRVTIRSCYISVNDDCIALKGTKGPLANEDKTSPPVEDVLVENCEFGDGNGLITCGSEATLVKNVTARNCRISGASTMLTLKLRPDTPQNYENILLENIELTSGMSKLLGVAPWKQFFDLKGHKSPSRKISGVTIRNVKGSVSTLGSLKGNEGDVIENFNLENITLEAKNDKLDQGNITKSEAKNVMINGKEFSFK